MYFNISIDASVVSDKGLVRLNNEDNFYFNGSTMNERDRNNPIHISIQESNHEFLYAVCDGMGGEDCGEKASLISVSELKRFHNQKIDTAHYKDMEGLVTLLNVYIDSTNHSIYQASTDDGIRMGTTFAGLAILGNQAIAMNVGDSRVYFFRDSILQQLTTDHTEAERLIRLGLLTNEAAKNHKSKHQLSRYLGLSPEQGRLEATLSNQITFAQGDIFMVCSDGLTDMLNDKDLTEILNSGEKSIDISTTLLSEALKNGGKDNITAMVMIIEEIQASL